MGRLLLHCVQEIRAVYSMASYSLWSVVPAVNKHLLEGNCAKRLRVGNDSPGGRRGRKMLFPGRRRAMVLEPGQWHRSGMGRRQQGWLPSIGSRLSFFSWLGWAELTRALVVS